MCENENSSTSSSAQKVRKRASPKMSQSIRSTSKSKLKKAKATLPADHHDELRRINRLVGQLEGVRRMIEDRRYCIDILTQTRAVTAALRSLESAILRGHMKHCLHGALTSSNPREVDDKIEELIELFNRKSN